MECCETNIKIRDEKTKKRLVSRLNIIIGQTEGIKKMIENDRYCDDVLIQLAALTKAIKSLANVILDDHMHTCLIENIKNGNDKVVDEIVELFKRFQ